MSRIYVESRACEEGNSRLTQCNATLRAAHPVLKLQEPGLGQRVYLVKARSLDRHRKRIRLAPIRGILLRGGKRANTISVEARPEPFGSRGHQLRPSHSPAGFKGKRHASALKIANPPGCIRSKRISLPRAGRDCARSLRMSGQDMTIEELPQRFLQGPHGELSSSVQTHLSWNEMLGQEESVGQTGGCTLDAPVASASSGALPPAAPRSSRFFCKRR